MGCDNLDLGKIREIINDILDYMIESSPQSSIRIGNDVYWDIGVQDMFDMSSKPDLSIGSISDDIEFLNEIKTASTERPVIFNLIHIAPILRALAEKYSVSNEL